MKKILIITGLVILILTNCTEKIDIELDDTYTRLVVDGVITSDTMAHRVRLTKTTSYYYNQPSPAVSGAVVTISDGINPKLILHETEQGSGIYETEPDVFGIHGRTYTLNIELDNEVGEHTHYTAECKMNPVAPLDSIKLEYREFHFGNFWEIKCYAWDPVTTDFYMFNVYKNGILITDTIDEVMAVDDRLFNGKFTNGIGAAWLDEEKEDEKVYPGDTIVLQMCSITEEYVNFIWEIQEETGYSMPLFSGPPANISSNINNGALGFFVAYSVSYAGTVCE